MVVLGVMDLLGFTNLLYLWADQCCALVKSLYCSHLLAPRTQGVRMRTKCPRQMCPQARVYSIAVDSNCTASVRVRPGHFEGWCCKAGEKSSAA